eukprot:Trichotokara_eunicae@DN8856_c0_g1_i1.p1
MSHEDNTQQHTHNEYKGSDDMLARVDDRPQVVMLKRMLTFYIRIIQKQLSDSIPKAIMMTMINELTEKVHTELVVQLMNEQTNTERLLKENDDFLIKRRI